MDGVSDKLGDKPGHEPSQEALDSMELGPGGDSDDKEPHEKATSAKAQTLRPGKLLRIGELAKRSGKSVRALHLYEELHLLQPVHRTSGGFRLYHPSSVERVEWISKLQEAGFSLSDLQEFLHEIFFEPAAPQAMARVREVFGQKLQETREQRMRLEKLEADLTSALSYLDGCRHCPPTHEIKDCPDCHLNGHDGSKPPLVAGIHNS